MACFFLWGCPASDRELVEQLTESYGLLFFMGLPRPAGGSGCAVARCSLGPSAQAPWSGPSGHYYPSLSLRRLCRLQNP